MLGATLVYGSLQVMLFAMYAVAYPTAAQVSKDPPRYLFAGTADATSLGRRLPICIYEIFSVMVTGLFSSAVITGFLTTTKSTPSISLLNKPPAFSADDINDLMHGRVRLAVMAYISGAGEGSFTFIMKAVVASDGYLSVHLRKLEKAGYLNAT